MLLSVLLAEETRARIEAERADDSCRPRAHFATPWQWIVASQKPEPGTSQRPLPLSQDLTTQAGRAPEVVVVGEQETFPPEDLTDRRALGNFPLSNVKSAHVTAALQPHAAQERVQLLKRRARLRFDVEPVARIARSLDPELHQHR